MRISDWSSDVCSSDLVSMKATVHIIGSSNRMRPRYMVNSQLNSLAPVGIEITIVVIPKKLLTLAPDPMVKKWCSQTRGQDGDADRRIDHRGIAKEPFARHGRSDL